MTSFSEIKKLTSNSSSLLKNQLVLDVLCAVLLVGAYLIFRQGLDRYFIEEANPVLLKLSIGASLGLEAVFCISSAQSRRHFFIRVAGSAVLFDTALYLAGFVRQEYVQARLALLEVPELMQVLGEDAYGLMANRLVGYAGSFALSVMLLRLTFAMPCFGTWTAGWSCLRIEQRYVHVACAR